MTLPPWLTRRVLGWALYDVASSTYIALVPAFFGLYFASVIARGQPGASAWWGATAAASLVLAGVLAPLVGAFADRSARWFPVLVLTTALCVLATIALPAVANVGVLAAAAGFIVAQVSYTLATSLYDSLVIDVAAPSHRGRISALGWAMGLFGGMLAVVVALVVMHGVPAAAQVDRLGAVFFVAGAMFAVLAVPGLSGLRSARLRPAGPERREAALASSLRAVGATLRGWREHRTTLQVLLSFFLINDVLVTLQFFIAIVIATRFGLTIEGVLWLALLFHAIAVPSTVVFGMLADRWGPKQAVAVMCAGLVGAILLLAFGRAGWAPTAAVALLGLVFASIQAVFRSLFGSLVAADRAAELFGFNAVAGRLSAAIGPMIFGAAAAAFGSSTVALCLLLLPLAAGLALLIAAPLSRYRQAVAGMPATAVASGDR